MHTIWPAYDGSGSSSWLAVTAVLKTTSPSPTDSAPSASPTKARPSSSTRAATFFLAGNDHRLVDDVVFAHEDLDPLRVRGGDVLADVVRPDGQLAMSAIDEHGELDGLRPPKVHQRVHRRARGSPVMDHVVDEDDHLAVDGWHLGGGAMRWLAQVAVVAVIGHVEPADRDAYAFQLGQDRGQAPCQDISLADDADQHNVVGAAIPLHDLVRDARERTADLICIHHSGLQPSLCDAHASNRSRRAMRTCNPLRAWRK